MDKNGVKGDFLEPKEVLHSFLVRLS